MKEREECLLAAFRFGVALCVLVASLCGLAALGAVAFWGLGLQVSSWPWFAGGLAAFFVCRLVSLCLNNVLKAGT